MQSLSYFTKTVCSSLTRYLNLCWPTCHVQWLDQNFTNHKSERVTSKGKNGTIQNEKKSIRLKPNKLGLIARIFFTHLSSNLKKDISFKNKSSLFDFEERENPHYCYNNKNRKFFTLKEFQNCMRPWRQRRKNHASYKTVPKIMKRKNVACINRSLLCIC